MRFWLSHTVYGVKYGSKILFELLHLAPRLNAHFDLLCKNLVAFKKDGALFGVDKIGDHVELLGIHGNAQAFVAEPGVFDLFYPFDRGNVVKGNAVGHIASRFFDAVGVELWIV